MEIVELCKKYRHEGVVAIDLAGDESLCSESNPDHRRAYEVRAKASCVLTVITEVCTELPLVLNQELSSVSRMWSGPQ